MSTNEPFISFLTPVYNGEDYISECIESILNQPYQNWEYIIVNNCSTDSTPDIIKKYAGLDSRIKIVNNDIFVDAETNHNIAFRQISSKSIYCKVVSADDWILPDCIVKMVDLAENNPHVGIIGSYQQAGDDVKWKGLSTDIQVITGKEVCRLAFLESLDVFGTPTSLLYRSVLVRENNPFFPNIYPYSDTSACYKYLQYFDFGFVHEVLSVERVHNQQISSGAFKLMTSEIAVIHNILEYASLYLTEEEIESLKIETLEKYYRLLGGCVLKMEGRKFWKMHSARLEELGYPLNWRKILKNTLYEVVDELRDPKIAFMKLFTVLKKKYSETVGKTSAGI
jgi:glycosyltransferase involved in cell wall biosynthesis